MSENQPLPVSGYTPQSDEKVALVNGFKQDEERLLKKVNILMDGGGIGAVDLYSLGMAGDHLVIAFALIARALNYDPTRMPEDERGDTDE